MVRNLSTHGIAQRLHSWISENSTPLGVFVVTRAGLILLMYLSLILLPVKSGRELWRSDPQNLFLDGWARWDSAWYTTIAQVGYNSTTRVGTDETNTAFFPLYPLLIRAMNGVTHNAYFSGLIVSNVAFLISLILLFRLVTYLCDAEIARRTIVLLAVFPFSFYFDTVYSESLFLLGAVAAFYFGERRQWVLAALGAAIAGGTRLVGVVTVLGLAVLYLELIGFEWRKIRWNSLWLSLGFVGLGGYMAYLAVWFGDPMLYTKSVQAGWGTAWYDWLLRTVSIPMSIPVVLAGYYPVMNWIQLLISAVALALSAWMVIRRWPRLAYALWTFLSVLVSLASWPGMGRYVLVLFPLFIVAASMLRDARWYQATLYVSTLLLSLFAILFSHWYWVT